MTQEKVEEMGTGKLLELLANQMGKGGSLISGGQIAFGNGDAFQQGDNGQFVKGGGDAIQTEKGAGKSLEPEEILQFIEKMQIILQEYDLPGNQKEKCNRHLEAVRDEVKEKNPDKEYAAKTLQKFTHILKETGKTIGSGVSLIDQLQPVISSVLPWLGDAQKFLIL